MSSKAAAVAFGGLYIVTSITSGLLSFTISTSQIELQYDNRVVQFINFFKVIEKCTNFYFGTEKLPPKF